MSRAIPPISGASPSAPGLAPPDPRAGGGFPTSRRRGEERAPVTSRVRRPLVTKYLKKHVFSDWKIDERGGSRDPNTARGEGTKQGRTPSRCGRVLSGSPPTTRRLAPATSVGRDFIMSSIREASLGSETTFVGFPATARSAGVRMIGGYGVEERKGIGENLALVRHNEHERANAVLEYDPLRFKRHAETQTEVGELTPLSELTQRTEDAHKELRTLIDSIKGSDTRIQTEQRKLVESEIGRIEEQMRKKLGYAHEQYNSGLEEARNAYRIRLANAISTFQAQIQANKAMRDRAVQQAGHMAKDLEEVQARMHEVERSLGTSEYRNREMAAKVADYEKKEAKITLLRKRVTDLETEQEAFEAGEKFLEGKLSDAVEAIRVAQDEKKKIEGALTLTQTQQQELRRKYDQMSLSFSKKEEEVEKLRKAINEQFKSLETVSYERDDVVKELHELKVLLEEFKVKSSQEPGGWFYEAEADKFVWVPLHSHDAVVAAAQAAKHGRKGSSAATTAKGSAQSKEPPSTDSSHTLKMPSAQKLRTIM